MTPPTLDVGMLHAKLRLVHQLLDDLDGLDEPVPVDIARLEGDRVVRYAVERILTQLVDVAASANAHLVVAVLGGGAVTYRQSFLLAARAGALSAELAERLAPAAGLRNVLVHDYVDVDLSLVVRGVALARTDFRSYVTELSSFLLGR